jgi:hypothetical protein
VSIVPQESEPVVVDPPEDSPPAAAATAVLPAAASTPPPADGPTTPVPTSESKSRLPIYIGAGVGLLLAVIAAVVVFGGSGGGSPEDAEAAATTTVPAAGADLTATTVESATEPTTSTSELPEEETAPPPTEAPTTVAEPTTTAAATTTTTTMPPPTPCPEGPGRTACITEISVDADGGLVAPFVTTGYTPELEPIDFHVHFYFDSVVGDDERNAGSAGSGGDWRLWDTPSTFTATGGDGGRPGYTLADGQAVGATQLCSIVATAGHAAVVGTGNCIDLPATATSVAAEWLPGYTTEIEANFVTSCAAEAGSGSEDACRCVFDQLATLMPFEQFVLLDSNPDLLDEAAVELAAEAIGTCAG